MLKMVEPDDADMCFECRFFQPHGRATLLNGNLVDAHECLRGDCDNRSQVNAINIADFEANPVDPFSSLEHGNRIIFRTR